LSGVHEPSVDYVREKHSSLWGAFLSSSEDEKNENEKRDVSVDSRLSRFLRYYFAKINCINNQMARSNIGQRVWGFGRKWQKSWKPKLALRNCLLRRHWFFETWMDKQTIAYFRQSRAI